MTILNAILLGFVAGVVSLKIMLLAAAALLLIGVLTRRFARPAPVPLPVPVAARRPRLDVRA